eukprot:24074_1
MDSYILSIALELYIVYNGIAKVVFGTTYHLTASSGQFTCSGTSSDTCVFYCDAMHSNPRFYCNNVGDCQFEISMLNCGYSGGTIYGGSAPNLHVTAPGNYMRGFTINVGDGSNLYVNVPGNGGSDATINGGAGSNLHITCGLNGCSDATINVGDGSNLYVDVSGNGFFDATINGGAGSNLYINCPSNGCSGLHINAANAHYLEVNVLLLWS